MALPQIWRNKPKAAPPPHYFEGFLEKKSPQQKDYKKYWAGLRGLHLYFYNTNKDIQYVEKIDLADFVSLADDNSPRSAATLSMDRAKLNLKLRSQEVKLKMESLESREMWKGFILTMVEMKVPSRLNLLPGHIYMLSEALEKEKERQSRVDQPDLKDEKELPDCFFRVSRTEAEVLLEKNENCGNMLLRPGGDGNRVSVTTRQKVNGTVSIKHYKVNLVGGEYIIDVEEQYHCSSLSGVVDFFVSRSKRILVPLSLDESYAMTLEIMETDKESGESALVAPRKPNIPLRLPKAGMPGEEQVFLPPRCRPPPLPVFPVQPTLKARTALPENVYEEDDAPDETYVNDEDVAEMRKSKPARESKHIPALAAPKKSSSGPGQRRTMEGYNSCLAMPLPRNFPTGIAEELERKLQERRATLQD
ncbi:signal-transducing adaptor protein 2 isoform X2 [Rhineura floridana]|uniref:signal-transducing adaptor protein 2 isoform X2 n=1 Tax=Rhineura floridana TaxID=261503 RepID=UPI002AC87A79|nr:signal-transducing adaptor protein 2 isoform X2 [Rhineura floridana]